MVKDPYFVSSINLEVHPMRYARERTKFHYYSILKYLVDIVDMITASEHIKWRMDFYRSFLVPEEEEIVHTEAFQSIDDALRRLPRKHKRMYMYLIICDLAVILDTYEIGIILLKIMKSKTFNKKRKQIDKLIKTLNRKGGKIPGQFRKMKPIIQQYWTNALFIAQKEKKIIITANMSAGKSTLINAIIGRNVARTSQEVCTGNICYFCNKAFDDKRVHFYSTSFSYDAEETDIKTFEWDRPVDIALYFRSAENYRQRICLIDTPGVNSAVNSEHGEIAKRCITSESYDLALYILNANKLGTEEEIRYLKWVSEHVPKEKVIFVLNKLDDFRASDDDMESSIDGVREDLTRAGFEKPMIFPISAYYAYLIKKKMSNQPLSEDEEDEYMLYTKKFNKPKYDLSRFYEETLLEKSDSPKELLKKSGFYYLEKLLYGGIS